MQKKDRKVKSMSKKDNGLSAIEYKSKTVLDKFDARFYCTSNKEIANVLGLCERQVNYYIKALKNINDKENETS